MDKAVQSECKGLIVNLRLVKRLDENAFAEVIRSNTVSLSRGCKYAIMPCDAFNEWNLRSFMMILPIFLEEEDALEYFERDC